jgi:hypothetical protein
MTSLDNYQGCLISKDFEFFRKACGKLQKSYIGKNKKPLEYGKNDSFLYEIPVVPPKVSEEPFVKSPKILASTQSL